MIHYQDNLHNITVSQLHGFFVGWPKPPTPDTHLKILKQSDYIVLAIDDNSNNVIGFVNAVSDGILCAYIPLLEVLPEYQGKGIGKELMRQMLEKTSDLYMVDLMCDSELQSYYAKLGMKPSTGMSLRNYERQAGE
jgi:ribosomal protein S18 acetylase RimI-like enzyme